MPNRVLRDWTDSPKVERITANAERLFTRLIMKADDYGRYHADVRLVRAGCFPLLPTIVDSDIASWLAECEKAALITRYTVGDREYLAILNFRQRTRQVVPKFPQPTGKRRDWEPVDRNTGPPDCPSDNGPSIDSQSTAYSEAHSEAQAQAQSKARVAAGAAGSEGTNGNGSHVPRKSDYAKFTEYFTSSWEKKYGVKFKGQPKDWTAAGRFFKSADGDLKRACAMVDLYLTDNDPFIAEKHSHALWLLDNQFNRLNVRVSAKKTRRAVEQSFGET